MFINYLSLSRIHGMRVSLHPDEDMLERGGVVSCGVVI